MSIAKNILKEVQPYVEREDDGRVVEPTWANIVRYCRDNSVSERETCPQSIDSSIIFTFADGSELRVANPDQVCFHGGISCFEDGICHYA
jgi:hypothetical protein